MERKPINPDYENMPETTDIVTTFQSGDFFIINYCIII